MAGVDPKNLLNLVEGLIAAPAVAPSPISLIIPLASALLEHQIAPTPMSAAPIGRAATAVDDHFAQLEARIKTLESRTEELQSALRLHLLAAVSSSGK